MGAGASFDNANNNETDLNRYFCHSCRRIFAMSTPPAGMHCPYCQSSFLEEFGPRGSARINSRDLRIGLSDEQARRLNNAATLLQILEAQLREELNNLHNAFSEAEARKTKPLTKTMLDTLKTANLSVDMMCDQPSCPICSEDYVLEEAVTKLPCNHVFHRPCVLPWLEMRRTCPICRFELTDAIPSVQDLSKLPESELLERLSVFNITFVMGTKTIIELSNELHNALIKQREDNEEAESQAAEEEEWRAALEEERVADDLLRRQTLRSRGLHNHNPHNHPSDSHHPTVRGGSGRDASAAAATATATWTEMGMSQVQSMQERFRSMSGNALAMGEAAGNDDRADSDETKSDLEGPGEDGGASAEMSNMPSRLSREPEDAYLTSSTQRSITQLSPRGVGQSTVTRYTTDRSRPNNLPPLSDRGGSDSRHQMGSDTADNHTVGSETLSMPAFRSSSMGSGFGSTNTSMNPSAAVTSGDSTRPTERRLSQTISPRVVESKLSTEDDLD